MSEPTFTGLAKDLLIFFGDRFSICPGVFGCQLFSATGEERRFVYRRAVSLHVCFFEVCKVAFE